MEASLRGKVRASAVSSRSAQKWLTLALSPTIRGYVRGDPKVRDGHGLTCAGLWHVHTTSELTRLVAARARFCPAVRPSS